MHPDPLKKAAKTIQIRVHYKLQTLIILIVCDANCFAIVQIGAINNIGGVDVESKYLDYPPGPALSRGNELNLCGRTAQQM